MDHEIYVGKTDYGTYLKLTVDPDGNRATVQARATDEVEWSPAVELERAPIEVPC